MPLMSCWMKTSMRSVPAPPTIRSSIRAFRGGQCCACRGGPQGASIGGGTALYWSHGQHQHRDDHPLGRVWRVLRGLCAVGTRRAAARAQHRPRPALAEQYRDSPGRYPDRALLVPTAAVGASLYAAGNGLGLINYLHLRLSAAALIGFLALDLVDLPSARRVPQSAGAVAAAPHAPRRSRHRRHHRRALSPARDPDLAVYQDGGDPRARDSGGRGHPVRGGAQRHLDVQPLQRVDAGLARSHRCGSSW